MSWKRYQTSTVLEPARAPFTEGEVLVYATLVTDDQPDRSCGCWHVTVLEPDVCLVGARRKLVRCSQRKADGAPRDGTDYKAIDHLFREVHP